MILGITGHQKLEIFDEKWIKSEIRTFLKVNFVEKGISCLAAGADQLFCDELIDNEIEFNVILPCENYRSTFNNNEDLMHFTFLLNISKNILTLDFEKPSEEAFYAAGIEMVMQSKTIIAIWDGEPAKGLGGTGDIVQIALNQKKDVYHINPVDQQSKYLNYG